MRERCWNGSRSTHSSAWGFPTSGLFIILTAAVTLNFQGVTSIETSAQAADALRPIAGKFAFLLFSLGIIGTGLLAVPVLAGSAAYAMAGTFRWKNSLEIAHRPVHHATILEMNVDSYRRSATPTQ